jgi:energy-coupling factor transporter ATP-binding protein EcfA2
MEPGEAKSQPTWLLIDEPEIGVHREAERRLANALRGVSEKFGINILIATHSPAMIAAAHGTYVVGRDRRTGYVTATPLSTDAAEVAAQVGLEVTDLLGWYRQILFVEGAHDEAILGVVLGDLILDTRTLVIPIKGVKSGAGLVDAALLDFTDAKIVILLDQVDDSLLTAFTETRGLICAGNNRGAQAAAKRAFGGGRYELKFLRSLVDHMIHPDFDAARVQVTGLAVHDVVELLPPGDFLPAGMTWADARSRFEQARSSDDFKEWLPRGVRAKPITIRSVTRSAQGLQTVPDELIDLVAILQGAERPVRQGPATAS